MKVVNWIIALLGLWEAGDIAALFVPDFGKIPIFVWNHMIIGIFLMILGVWAALTRHVSTAKTLDWAAATAGGWLVIASFVFRNPKVAIGLLNDVIVGIIVVILGVWAAIAARRAAG